MADHIVETSASLGLDLALPLAVRSHYRRAIEDGHGGENWSSSTVSGTRTDRPRRHGGCQRVGVARMSMTISVPKAYAGTPEVMRAVSATPMSSAAVAPAWSAPRA
ncbi:hypothetical protein QFZ58_006831 [Streptomyces sp. B1I3]|nr:hypothetical protein [Streptomyces sp. B1I3]